MKPVVIAGYARSPFCFAHKGELAKLRPDDLTAAVLKALIDRTHAKPEDIEDLLLGCAFPEGEQGLNVARLVTFIAKLPLSVAGTKVDDGWFGELTRKVGLTDRLKHRPAELSGGQQQRVAVARSLVAKPTIVFADEPTGNLDSRSGEEILHLLRDSSDAYGQTIVMVTHDPRAAAIADRILYLVDGKIVLDQKGATAAEVLQTMSDLETIAPS